MARFTVSANLLDINRRSGVLMSRSSSFSLETFGFFVVNFRCRRRPPALRDQVILGGIDADAVQPGIERTVAPESRQCPVGLDKGFLRHVLDFGRIPNKPRQQAHQLALVLRHQQPKSMLVACCARSTSSWSTSRSPMSDAPCTGGSCSCLSAARTVIQYSRCLSPDFPHHGCILVCH